ncbi:MAG TPA: phospholipid carrier-dependent glycosyltransferase [Victivallales bacterium]|nr:phospholipid carrier-dependent glycosyltransferase [Victivallales bacterium]
MEKYSNGGFKYSFFVFIFFILVYLIPLGISPLVEPDETRYAEIPREMIVNDNWVVPYMDGIRYYQKPVLAYWMNAISELIFGYNAFAVRLASALTTGLAALLIYFFVRNFLKDKFIAALSSLVFLSFGMVLGIGTFAVLDAQTSFFLTGALIMFYFAYKSKSQWTCNIFLALSGLFTGGGFMTKGFLVFAVMAFAVAPFLIWEKKWKRMFTMMWVPIIFAIGISLPWAIAVYLRAPDFWKYFFFDQNVKRYFTDTAGQHPEPLWFLLPILIAGTLPWTIQLPSIVLGLRKNNFFKHPLMRYGICWVVLPFIFFSFCSGKLPTYVLPCFPPLAVFTAYGLYLYLKKDINGKIFSYTLKFLAIVFFIGGVGFILYQLIAFTGKIPGLYLPNEYWKWIIAFIAILIFIYFVKCSLKSKNIQNKLFLFAIAPIAIMAIKSVVIPDQIMYGKEQGKFILAQAKYIQPDTMVLAYPNMLHSVSWYLKRDNIYVYGNTGEFSHGLNYPDAKYRFISTKKLQELIKSGKHKGNIAFFMRGDFREGIPASKIEDYKHRMMFSKL